MLCLLASCTYHDCHGLSIPTLLLHKPLHNTTVLNMHTPVLPNISCVFKCINCCPQCILQAVSAGNGGVDIIAEMLSNVNLETDLQLAASGGRVAVCMGGGGGRLVIYSWQLLGARWQYVCEVDIFLAQDNL